jgi:acyl-CoA synthetase (NDP forming)
MRPAVVERILETGRREHRKALLEPEAKEICRAYKMPTQDFYVARSATDAADLAEKITFPVVLKIVSPDILHKTEVGGVMLDVRSKREVRQGYNQIIDKVKAHNENARILGVLVQHMAPKGIEVIVGGVRDRQFGPTILFGLGGIFVEVLKDVTFRVAPLSRQDSREMIRGIRSYPILKGARGQPPADEEAIVHMLIGASRIMLEYSAIEQLDLNPVLVYESGASIVDARIILTDQDDLKDRNCEQRIK